MTAEALKPFNKILCNWLTNDFKGLLKKYGLEIDDCGIDPNDFFFLVKLHSVGVLTKKELREILEHRLKLIKEAHDNGRPCPEE
jgi:Asp-tRNA(Asn)/Glu-tRNA(Gln) amidotransferase B subunit